MFEKMKGIYKTVKTKVVEIEKKVKMAEDIFDKEVESLLKTKVKDHNV